MGAHLRNGKKISFKQKAAAATATARDQQLRPSSREQQPSVPRIEAAAASVAVSGEHQLHQPPANPYEHLPGALSYATHPASAIRGQQVPGSYVSLRGSEDSPSAGRNAPSLKLQGDQTNAGVYPPFPSSQGATPRAGDGFPLPVDRQDFLVTRREAPTTPQPTVPQQMSTPRARARESAPPMTPSPNQLVLREMT
ncbi:hypothetical protein PCASD_14269 [Puccinia coronata f. sp. avenae]|uniref:Uncharacterized protein n=1 Tax=Puccinia coronata f. sp. avenae TaxID=200324 RepID=A0A2N5TF07_9BASI|nr:hypothetical protein PCASD_14269 [Puccinia coronata f. sp. avenae]